MCIILADSSEQVYLPFIPRISDENIGFVGTDDTSRRAAIVSFPFGNESFNELYVSSELLIVASDADEIYGVG